MDRHQGMSARIAVEFSLAGLDWLVELSIGERSMGSFGNSWLKDVHPRVACKRCGICCHRISSSTFLT